MSTGPFSVVIPWRPDDGPRDELLEWTLARWRALYGADVHRCLGLSVGESFNVSAARNEGFRNARARFDDDVVVIADGDTPPIEPFLSEAIRRARQGSWVLPFGDRAYYVLEESASTAIRTRGPATDIPRPVPGEFEDKQMHFSGMVVVPAAAYEAVGGYDEAFDGWGYEDNAFAAALDTLWGPGERLAEGHLTHLWHPVGPNGRWEDPHVRANQLLYQRYDDASGDVDAMRSLIAR